MEKGEPTIYVPWQILAYMTTASVAGIIVSLFTKPVAKSKLDCFYGLTRTPVQPGEKIGPAVCLAARSQAGRAADDLDSVRAGDSLAVASFHDWLHRRMWSRRHIDRHVCCICLVVGPVVELARAPAVDRLAPRSEIWRIQNGRSSGELHYGSGAVH